MSILLGTARTPNPYKEKLFRASEFLVPVSPDLAVPTLTSAKSRFYTTSNVNFTLIHAEWSHTHGYRSVWKMAGTQSETGQGGSTIRGGEDLKIYYQ